MGTDWGITCLDCFANDASRRNSIIPENMRHFGACQLRDAAPDLAVLATVVKKIEALGVSVDVEVDSRHFDPSWFVAHAGHRLAVVNEYGDLDGDCSMPVQCGSCDSRHRCKLPEGHPGECSPKRPPP